MSDEPKINISDAETDAPDAKLAECEKQRDEYLNGWKRAQADFANYKKGEGARFSEIATYAAADIVRDLLPVLDSFDLGMNALDQESAAYKGMAMIRGQLQDVLRKKGVDRIVVKRGDVFDPGVHEAMMEVEIPPNEADRESLVGKVFEEMVAGYTMSGKVIRAVKVKLGR